MGIGEVGFAETPDGGILGSGRNGIFHGPGKCNCRGTVRSTDGGDTFGPLGFDPVLVEPECMVRNAFIWNLVRNTIVQKNDSLNAAKELP